MLRRLLGVASLVALLAVTAGPASAATTVDHYTVGDWSPEPIVVDGICDFTLTVTPHGWFTEVDRYDADGVWLGSQWTVRETDTFTANGKTLVGERYAFHGSVTGDFSRLQITGIAEKVRLPDGTLFVSAGYVAFPTWLFGLTPDRGAAGDVEAFCAALS